MNRSGYDALVWGPNNDVTKVLKIIKDEITQVSNITWPNNTTKIPSDLKKGILFLFFPSSIYPLTFFI